MIISRIRRTAAPLKGKHAKVCMLGEVPDVITHIKFNVERSGGF